MKAELEQIIAKIEELETRELTEDERRLLAEAKSRLITIWQGRSGELVTRNGMIVSPLDDPMVQEFIDDEIDGGDQ